MDHNLLFLSVEDKEIQSGFLVFCYWIFVRKVNTLKWVCCLVFLEREKTEIQRKKKIERVDWVLLSREKEKKGLRSREREGD